MPRGVVKGAKRGRHKPPSAKLRREMRKARREGQTLTRIADWSGVARSTVWAIIADIPVTLKGCHNGVRKCDQGKVLQLLDWGSEPKVIAERYGISVDWVYVIRSRGRKVRSTSHGTPDRRAA
jgi:hypothetical protein